MISIWNLSFFSLKLIYFWLYNTIKYVIQRKMYIALIYILYLIKRNFQMKHTVVKLWLLNLVFEWHNNVLAWNIVLPLYSLKLIPFTYIYLYSNLLSFKYIPHSHVIFVISCIFFQMLPFLNTILPLCNCMSLMYLKVL